MKGSELKMKHTREELAQMQSLSLDMKIRMSQRRIRDWYEHFEGQVYVSFSGGKDSTVLKHLVETTPGVYEVPSVFVDTGLEYPEVRMFATKNADVVLRPEMRFDEVIEKYGYPVISKRVSEVLYFARKGSKWAIEALNGRNVDGSECKFAQRYIKYKYLLDAPFDSTHKCCNVMKKKPFYKFERESGRKAIIGSMASESFARQKAWEINGCNAFDSKRQISKPMSFWTEQDVLEYIVRLNLDYAKVYGDIVFDGEKYSTTGVDRTGCMFCMFGCHLEKEPNRFQRMKETHPRQYDYCMNKLGLKEVLEYINVPYE